MWIKSRRHTDSDSKFIEAEANRLIVEDVIETSLTSWRKQALVTTNENHKQRKVIDYSRPIIRYTLLDAYPLPRIDDIENKVANYAVYSTPGPVFLRRNRSSKFQPLVEKVTLLDSNASYAHVRSDICHRQEKRSYQKNIIHKTCRNLLRRAKIQCRKMITVKAFYRWKKVEIN